MGGISGFNPWSIIVAIIGAIIVLVVYNAVMGLGLSRPVLRRHWPPLGQNARLTRFDQWDIGRTPSRLRKRRKYLCVTSHLTFRCNMS